MKETGMDEFIGHLKTDKNTEYMVRFDGVETPAPVTGNRYLFLQIVTWCGEDNLMSSYRTWDSGERFFLIYGDFKVRLDKSAVRTFIERTGSFEEKDPGTGRMIPSDEYGLVKGRTYYMKVSSEEYYLPPENENGGPQKRVNHVLWISSKPFIDGKPQVELTPLYKGWSY